jgi:hypothetical protein
MAGHSEVVFAPALPLRKVFLAASEELHHDFGALLVVYVIDFWRYYSKEWLDNIWESGLIQGL